MKKIRLTSKEYITVSFGFGFMTALQIQNFAWLFYGYYVYILIAFAAVSVASIAILIINKAVTAKIRKRIHDGKMCVCESCRKELETV